MLNTEKLDRLQQRLELGLELVALARKGLEAERLETLANGYKVANEEAQEIMAELRNEVERLNKEADWLAERISIRDCVMGDTVENCIYKEFPCAECFREAARKAVEVEK